jgi:glycine dehydrogenase subunit 2
MVEPTETESLETLDAFVDVMREIAERAASDPESIKRTPVTTPVGRLDEAAAARRPDLRYRFGEGTDATAAAPQPESSKAATV